MSDHGTDPHVDDRQRHRRPSCRAPRDRGAAPGLPRAEGQRPPQAAQPPEPRGAGLGRSRARRVGDPDAALRADRRRGHAAQHDASARRSSPTSSTRSSASGRSSRCCAIRRSATSWSTPTRTSTSSGSGKLEQLPTTFQDDKHLMRVIDRIVSGVGRRVDDSSPMVDARLRGRLARQRDHSAAGGRRPAALDSPLSGRAPQGAGPGQHPVDDAADARVPRALRARPPQHADQRRHRRRQDDAAQRAVGVHLRARAHRHHRGRGRAAAAPGARRAARDAAAQRRRQGRDQAAAAAGQRPAHAPRPHRRRRDARRGSARHAAGDEHRPRRLADDRPREHAARRAVENRDDDRDGRDQPARARDAPADRRRRSRSSSSSRA